MCLMKCHLGISKFVGHESGTLSEIAIDRTIAA